MRASLSQMVMQKDTRIYPGSGNRRTYVQRGGDNLYYFAPMCLYRGEYKHGMECGNSMRMSVVLPCSSLLSPLLGFPFYSSNEKPKVQV